MNVTLVKTGFVFLFMMLFAAFVARSDEGVQLRAEVVVAGETLRLGNLVASADKEQVDSSLMEMEIGNSPSIGRTLVLSGKVVRTKLDQQGATSQGFRVPATIKVRRSSQSVKPDRIKRLVTEYIGEKIPWTQYRHKVDFTADIRTLEVSPGNLELKCKPAPNTSYAGRASFLVLVYVNSVEEKRVWVRTKIHVYATAIQAANTLRKFHHIGEIDLVKKEVDLANSPGDVFLDGDNLVGLRTKQPIRAGSFFTRRSVELPPVLKRGDVVTIILTSGSMQIKAMGQVKEDGYSEQRVKVLNLQTKRTIYARVIDDNTVFVDF